MRRLSLIAIACALTACLGEPYQRPALDVPAQFRFAMAETISESRRMVQWPPVPAAGSFGGKNFSLAWLMST